MAAEVRGEYIDSQGYTEEKTEPFSQSEIEARMQLSRIEAFNAASSTSVPLDELIVPKDKDYRAIIRPWRRSVSPFYQDNWEWLALGAEVSEQDQPQHKVLAVSQTSRDIKFSVRIPGERLQDRTLPPIWCEIYFDPASDNQILLNRSDVPIVLSRVTRPDASPRLQHTVNPGNIKALSPGTWRITAREMDVLDFRILEKRPATLRLPADFSSDSSVLSEMVNSSGKRSLSFSDDDGSPTTKRLRFASASSVEGGDRVIMFLPQRTDPFVFPLFQGKESTGLVPVHGHPLLEAQKGQTVEIPGGCELDEYHITKRDSIASTTLSTVFTANHSDVQDGVITVKVLKTRASTNNALAKANENERNVIRQADIWLREFQSHEGLKHEGIVRLFGGDARYLSLYLEHVDAKDLASKGHWRNPESDLFRGDRADAERILRDITGALHYIHGRGLVHNDIKPANILYSRERGAVLCDFGLSTHATNPPSSGGTPYYVPPEFIGRKQRGAPSDVWALGVTMLYVLGKITFPDARGSRAHPRPLYWMIADLNRAATTGRAGGAQQPTAVSQMWQWLSEVSAARAPLDLKKWMDLIVYHMLAPQPGSRITMRRVMEELCRTDRAVR